MRFLDNAIDHAIANGLPMRRETSAPGSPFATITFAMPVLPPDFQFE